MPNGLNEITGVVYKINGRNYREAFIDQITALYAMQAIEIKYKDELEYCSLTSGPDIDKLYMREHGLLKPTKPFMSDKIFFWSFILVVIVYNLVV